MGSQNKKSGRKVKTIPPSKKPKRKKGSSTTPIIIAVIGGMLLLLTIIIMVASGGRDPGNGGQASTATVKGEEKKSKKAPTTKESKKSNSTTKKTPAATDGPKVVNYNQAFAKKPGPDGTTEPTSDPATTAAPTTVTTKPKAVVEKPKPANAKEASIANLKAIGVAYKKYSDSHDGHMPIELFQLNLEASVLKSPLTSKEYIVEQAGKGSFLNESLENIIVREASPVDGKYLCLYGNGEVKEATAGELEQ